MPFTQDEFRAESIRQRIKHGTVHFVRVLWPTGFALEGLRDAKRVYEKTKGGRARDARQELHNAGRAATPPR